MLDSLKSAYSNKKIALLEARAAAHKMAQYFYYSPTSTQHSNSNANISAGPEEMKQSSTTKSTQLLIHQRGQENHPQLDISHIGNGLSHSHHKMEKTPKISTTTQTSQAQL